MQNEKLGPLAPLVGIWEGEKGFDIALSNIRGTEHNHFKERITFDPISQTDNHEQVLFGLRYSTVATRIGADAPFHEELGYWLWDATEKQVMRCFVIPRGIALLAGGTANAEDREFHMLAEVGSARYGICSNPFLDREFKTVRYELKVTIHDDHSFSYDEDSQILIKGKTEVFHHRDKNTLKRL